MEKTTDLVIGSSLGSELSQEEARVLAARLVLGRHWRTASEAERDEEHEAAVRKYQLQRREDYRSSPERR